MPSEKEQLRSRHLAMDKINKLEEMWKENPEATLAALLAQGSDLDEAATELGIRRNTARSHLQSIFMKTDVKRQSELVRMILSSVATLSN